MSYDGKNVQWVAVAGEADANPWIGRIEESSQPDDGGVMQFRVTWLEPYKDPELVRLCQYQFCKEYSSAWISIDAVIVFGVHMQTRYCESAGKAILELKTPMSLLKKLSASQDPKQTFGDLVSDVCALGGPAIQQIVKERPKKIKFRWESESHLIDAICDVNNVKSKLNK